MFAETSHDFLRNVALYNLRKILNRHRNFTLVTEEKMEKRSPGRRKSTGVSPAFRNGRACAKPSRGGIRCSD
jgi:hypothetical protein